MSFSYRDFLSEEIEIQQLMLCRKEFLLSNPKFCTYCSRLLSKINQLENELSDFDSQLAA